MPAGEDRDAFQKSGYGLAEGSQSVDSRGHQEEGVKKSQD